MGAKFKFTFNHLKSYFQTVKENGYEIITCKEYVDFKQHNNAQIKVLVNRVDIDVSCKKAKRLAQIFNELEIKATFFVRLHAVEYNPFDFENYNCLKFIKDTGHEIGYHSEVIDQSVIWEESEEECLKRDIQVLNTMLNIKVDGVASHGGFTGLNNLDFWQNRLPSDFGLLYEAYDQQPEFNLFQESLYISDSEWTKWKCYDKGKLVDGDARTLGEHAQDGHPIIYSLIHPETYYDEHFYE